MNANITLTIIVLIIYGIGIICMILYYSREQTKPEIKIDMKVKQLEEIPEILPEIILDKFQKNPQIKTTGWNEIGNPIDLSKHHPDCENNAINNFKLDTMTTKMQYVYNCAENKGLGDIYEKVNDRTEPESGNWKGNYLEKQNVTCGTNEVLSKFGLNNLGAKGWQYVYKCSKSKTPLECRNVTTPPTDIDIDYTNLKLHSIKCEDDEALSQFKLESLEPNKIYYSYKCCK
jgi:hypothetical protein